MARLLVITTLLLSSVTAHARNALLARLLDRQPLPAKISKPRQAKLETTKSQGPIALVKIAQLAGPAKIEEIPPHTFGGGFHGTRKPPDEVLRVGLKAHGDDWRLDHHVSAKYHRSRSAFRGTTAYVLSPDGESGAALWPGKGGYVYEICNVPTWEVNAALEGSRILPGGIHTGNPLYREHEFAIPGKVSPKQIKRWAQVEISKSGHPIIREWHDNPSFVDP